MEIEFYEGELNLEFNEYMQFSLYDKEGKPAHYQVTHMQSIARPQSIWENSYSRHTLKRSLTAEKISKLTVETPEEKLAKEAVKKAKESLKAAEDTLKAVKEKK